MKKTIVMLAAACSMLLACNKLPQSEVQRGPVTLTVSGLDEAVGTKSSVAAAETAVKKLEIYVFNGSGDVDGYAKVENPSFSGGSCSVTLSCTRGSGMTVAAFLNSPADISVTDYAAYRQRISYLGDNSMAAFQMAGVVEGTDLSAGTATVPVDRFVAKVQLDRISNNFVHDLTVDAVYLININPSCPYSMVPTAAAPSDWINRRTYSASAVDTLVHDSVGSNVSAGTSLQGQHIFYTYPNPATADSSDGGSFTPRYTRLVVEATLDGAKTYYPVNIVSDGGILHPNTFYNITDLRISGPGSDDPDILPERGSVSVSVTITDWKTGFTKLVEY